MTPGTLRLIKARANPQGADDSQLFLFTGNPTIAPVREIIPDEGVTLPLPRADLSSCSCRLKIFHLNDLHGHLARFTPQGEQPILSRIVNRLRKVRRQYREDPDTAVLAMSAGDDLVGAVFDELMGDDPDSFALHAGYRLYSAAGMDVSVLGNHDFDLGTDVLSQAILRDAQFPVLSANLVGCHWLSDLYHPAALLVTKGIRVGIIGLTTPGAIRQPPDSNLQITNPMKVIDNLLPAIRPLCDILIILSHLGYSLSSGSAAVRIAGDVELALSLPPGGVHLIIGGHTHNILNKQGLTTDNIVNGIPIVQAGMLGRYLGEADITFNKGAAAVSHVRLTHTASLPVDEDFEEGVVQPLMDVARPVFFRSLGHVADHPDLSTGAVHNNFAAGESALANFIADALVARCRANSYDVDFALVDTSAVRCGLPNNKLTYGDWFNLMPFADVLRVTWITGQQLQMLIQDNAYRIDLPGEPHTERGFLHCSRQIRYTIEIGNGDRSIIRAAGITLNGIPLDQQLDRSFELICSSFVRGPASSWERYGRRTLGLPLMDINQLSHRYTPLFLRDELVAYITENGGVTEAGGVKRDGRVQIVRKNEQP